MVTVLLCYITSSYHNIVYTDKNTTPQVYISVVLVNHNYYQTPLQ